MIPIRINSKDYLIKTRWDEFTLKECVPFHAIAVSMPDVLREKYEIYKANDYLELLTKWTEDLTEEDNEAINGFHARVIRHMTGCNDGITPDSLATLYMTYYDLMVFDLINGYSIEGEDIDGFNEYTLPEDENVRGHTTPMKNLKLSQFCDASDALVLAKDNIMFLGLVAAVLTGKDEEERVIHERMYEFQNLTMDVVWNVVHRFNQFNRYIVDRCPNLFKGGKKGGLKSNWNSVMLDIASRSNYLLSLQEIGEGNALEWLRIRDREEQIRIHQNEQQK